MLAFANPALLLAGALAALIPLLLHLIRRRPSTRVAFPTERFLTPDPRTQVRLSRPTDLLLLALRMALLLLAGAALARPVWHPAARGTAEIVLLERGLGAQGAALARARLLDAGGRARGTLVLFDSTATPVPQRGLAASLFDTLAAAPASARPSRYAAALAAVAQAAAALPRADSLHLTLITRSSASAWTPGLAPLRRAVWPGSLALELVSAPASPAPAADPVPVARRRAAVIGGEGAGRFVMPALQATGWTVTTARDSADLLVLLAPPPAEVAAGLKGELARGATLLVTGPAAAALSAGASPWTSSASAEEAAGSLWFADGSRAEGMVRRWRGSPAAGSAVLARGDDGRPLAAARRVGPGCSVFVATALEEGGLPLDPGFPRALDGLARGCGRAAPSSSALSLDAGAEAVLRGSGPDRVARSRVPGAGGGTALLRWVLAAALAVALCETFLAYGRRRAV